MPNDEDELKEQEETRKVTVRKARFMREVLDAIFSGYNFLTSLLWNANLYVLLIIANPFLAPIFFFATIITAVISGYYAWSTGREKLPEVREENENTKTKELLRSIERLKAFAKVKLHKQHPIFDEFEVLEMAGIDLLEKIGDPSWEPGELLEVRPIPVKETNPFARGATNLLTLLTSYMLGFWFIYTWGIFAGAAVFTTAAAFLWPLLFVAVAAIPLYLYDKNRKRLYNTLDKLEIEKNRTFAIEIENKILSMKKYMLEKNIAQALADQAFSDALRSNTPHENAPKPIEKHRLPADEEERKRFREKLILPSLVPFLDVAIEKEKATNKLSFWPRLNMIFAFISGLAAVTFLSFILTEFLKIAMGHALAGSALMLLSACSLGIGIVVGIFFAYLHYQETVRELEATEKLKEANDIDAKVIIFQRKKEIIATYYNTILLLAKQVNDEILKDLEHPLPVPLESLDWIKDLNEFISPELKETGMMALFLRIFPRARDWSNAYSMASRIVRAMMTIIASFAAISATALILSPTGIGLTIAIAFIYATAMMINTYTLSRTKAKTIQANKEIDLEIEKQNTVIRLLEQNEKSLRYRIDAIEKFKTPGVKHITYPDLFPGPRTPHPKKEADFGLRLRHQTFFDKPSPTARKNNDRDEKIHPESKRGHKKTQ